MKYLLNHFSKMIYFAVKACFMIKNSTFILQL